MKRFLLMTLGMAALNVVILSGCQRGSGKIKVGFVSNNAAEFWTIAEAGAKRAAADFDVELIFKRPQRGAADEQKQIIEDLLTRNVRGIAISVIHPDAQTDFLDQVAARIPVVTQDNDAPRSQRKCYIGTDNYAAGKAAGQLVKEALPDGGTIAIFVGLADSLNARQRRAGILDELAGHKDARGDTYGKYRLIGTYYDNADEKRAKDHAADVLTKLGNQPHVCLIGLWAYNAPAILSAVMDAGKQGKVHIVGFDEHENTLQGIEEGAIQGTVVQQPFEFGYQSVQLLANLARDPTAVKLPPDGIRFVPHQIIKKDNVEKFHKRLRELLHKGYSPGLEATHVNPKR